MKKTLLTVALAALATTAFANTNFYSYQGQDTSANLYVGTSLQLRNFEHKYDMQVDNNAKVGGTKYHNETRTDVVFGGDITDANKVTYSFYAKARHTFYYEYVKSKGVKSQQTHHREGFALQDTHVSLSSPMYGMFTFGNTDTAAQKMGSFANNVPGKVLKTSAFGASDSSQNAFVYTLPDNLVEGLGVQVSYGLDKTSHLSYTNEYAANVSYDLMGTTLGSTLAVTTTKADHKTTNTMTSFDLSAMNSSLMDDLTVGGEFAYNLDKAKGEAKNKTSAYSFTAKAKYNVNMYFMPYAGLTYLHSKTTTTTTSTTKQVGGYLGFNSTLYTYGPLTVKGYLEGALAKDKTTVKEDKKADQVTKFTHKYFATGLTFSF